MKRGFLNSSKAKQQDEQSISLPVTKAKLVSKLSHGVVPNAGQIPKGYESGFGTRKFFELNATSLDYDPDLYVCTAVPLVTMDAKLSDVPGGWAECVLSGHVKRMIHTTPGFPRRPLSPANGKKLYRIGEAGSKGLGMFATRLIRAGEIIIDERPMMVATASTNSIVSPDDMAKLSVEQIRQIGLREWGKFMKVVFDRMPPENQKAFMELANSHTQDGSDDITGRIRTNGVVTGFRDRNSSGAQGRYTAICKDISRINHSCRPNASWSWHTDSFSLRVCAVRDIRAGEEVTVAYCDALAPAAERAEALVPYGIYNCNCGPSCNDPAGIRIGDKRRDRFRFEPVVVFAPHVPPKVGEAPDAWVKPALRRFRELEAEGLEGCNEYHRTAYQLINVYCFLQDVEKVKKYASKIKGVHRVIEKKEFPASFSSAEGIERSQYYQMSEMRKKAGIPESAPILISFA